MNKDSEEYKRVVDEVAQTIRNADFGNVGSFYVADQILSIKGIAILSDDQIPPTRGFKYPERSKEADSYFDCRDDMLEENFRRIKCYKEE